MFLIEIEALAGVKFMKCPLMILAVDSLRNEFMMDGLLSLEEN